MARAAISVRSASGVGLLVGIGVIEGQPSNSGQALKVINPIADQYYLGNTPPVVANPIGILMYAPS